MKVNLPYPGCSAQQINDEYRRPSADECFLRMAFIAAERSHDSETQHACLLVKDGRIISTGVNGFPAGSDDANIPNKRPHKYSAIIHAEANAVINAAREGISIKDATAYVTGHPCLECTKILIQSGIRDWVIGGRGHFSTEANEAIREYFLKWFDIQIRRYEQFK